MKPALAVLLACLLLANCATDALSSGTPSPVATAVSLTPSTPTEEPALTLASKEKRQVRTLRFTVDPNRSTGHFDTILKPARLTARAAKSRTPLTGTITARLVQGDDNLTIQLTDVALRSTEAAQLTYNWSLLVGKICTTLPARILKIDDHTLTGAVAVGPDNKFRCVANSFTIDCAGNIAGSGLILSEAVGNRKIRLDIPKTSRVDFDGSLHDTGKTLELRIPSAVLRDRFDMGDAVLDLTFTGDLVATARK